MLLGFGLELFCTRVYVRMGPWVGLRTRVETLIGIAVGKLLILFFVWIEFKSNFGE